MRVNDRRVEEPEEYRQNERDHANHMTFMCTLIGPVVGPIPIILSKTGNEDLNADDMQNMLLVSFFVALLARVLGSILFWTRYEVLMQLSTSRSIASNAFATVAGVTSAGMAVCGLFGVLFLVKAYKDGAEGIAGISDAQVVYYVVTCAEHCFGIGQFLAFAVGDFQRGLPFFPREAPKQDETAIE